jgi:hypothetical protein
MRPPPVQVHERPADFGDAIAVLPHQVAVFLEQGVDQLRDNGEVTHSD